MQERGDRGLLVEAVRGGKRQHIDADKVAVGAGLNEPLDGRRRIGIGHIALRRKQGLALAHAQAYGKNGGREPSCCH